jgi:uncharacterized protein
MIPGLPPIRTIARTELAAAASTITFSGINTLVAALPFTARHLGCTINGRVDGLTDIQDLNIRLGPDGSGDIDDGSNYHDQYVRGASSTASGARANSQTTLSIGRLPGKHSTAYEGSVLTTGAELVMNFNNTPVPHPDSTYSEGTSVGAWGNIGTITTKASVTDFVDTGTRSLQLVTGSNTAKIWMSLLSNPVLGQLYRMKFSVYNVDGAQGWAFVGPATNGSSAHDQLSFSGSAGAWVDYEFYWIGSGNSTFFGIGEQNGGNVIDIRLDSQIVQKVTLETVVGASSFVIPHAFNTANHKTALSMSGAAELEVEAVVGRWASTAAITQLQLLPGSGDFDTGTVAELFVIDEDYAVEEQLLAANGTFTFSDLDDLVQEGDLVGIGYARSTIATTAISVLVDINDDADPANYERQRLEAYDSTAGAAAGAVNSAGMATAANSDSNTFGAFLVGFSAFGKTANDVSWNALSGTHGSSSSSFVRMFNGRWNNTAAITSLKFQDSSNGNFVSGSMMSLYHVPKRLVDYAELESDTTSVTFSDIPQGFEDLRLTCFTRTDRVDTNDEVVIYFNGDTTSANYDRQYLSGAASAVSASRSAANKSISQIPAANTGTNEFGSSATLISQYAKTDRHKHLLTIFGRDGSTMGVTSIRWENTAAITSINLIPAVGPIFKAGSIFMLEAIGGIDSELQTTKAEYVVEVDWSNDGKFDGTGDDITTSVMSAQWQRGRGSPVTITALSQPGKASVLLLDQGAEYSPLNTGATLFGKLLPGRPMRIRTKTPFPVTEWQGKIDSIQHRPSVDGYHTAIITGIGPFDVVGKAEVNSQIITGTNTGGIVNNVLTEAGWDATARDIDTGQTTPTRYFAGPRKALFSLREMESTEVGFLVEGRSNKIKFEDRYHRMRGKHLESQTTIADNEAVSPIRYGALQVEDPSEAIFNQFQAQVVIYSNGAANATLWSHPEAVAGTSAPIIKAGKTIEFFAYFPNRNAGGTETQANDATAIAVGGWVAPTATVDFNVFDTSAATGSIMNAEVFGTLAGTFANAAKMSIQNTGTRDGYLTHAQLRGTAILASAPVVVEAIDGSSTSTYGLRSMAAQSNAQWIPNTEEAQENVNAKLAAFKDPQAFLQVPYRAELNLNSMHAALKRDISDRITVSGTAAGSFGGDGDYFIESEQHRITADRQHQVSYLVSPVGGLSGWWVVGFSKLGTDTKAGF